MVYILPTQASWAFWSEWKGLTLLQHGVFMKTDLHCDWPSREVKSYQLKCMLISLNVCGYTNTYSSRCCLLLYKSKLLGQLFFFHTTLTKSYLLYGAVKHGDSWTNYTASFSAFIFSDLLIVVIASCLNCYFCQINPEEKSSASLILTHERSGAKLLPNCSEYYHNKQL